MCGIAFVKNKIDNSGVNQVADMVYSMQKDRGSEGFGVIGYTDKKFYIQRGTAERDFKDMLYSDRYDEILFHHRFPTSTKNTLKTAHPFSIERGETVYHFVHNGVIGNASEVKKYHDELGIKYQSIEGTQFNDSEALAHEVVRYLEGDTDKILARGSVAFLCLEQDKKTLRARRLWFYHNEGNPLTMINDKGMLALASENLPEKVKENILYYYDYESKNIVKKGRLEIEYGYSFGFSSQYDKDYAKYDEELEEYDEIIQDEYFSTLDELELLCEEYHLAMQDGDYNGAKMHKLEADLICEEKGIEASELSSWGIDFYEV